MPAEAFYTTLTNSAYAALLISMRQRDRIKCHPAVAR